MISDCFVTSKIITVVCSSNHSRIFIELPAS